MLYSLATFGSTHFGGARSDNDANSPFAAVGGWVTREGLSPRLGALVTLPAPVPSSRVWSLPPLLSGQYSARRTVNFLSCP